MSTNQTIDGPAASIAQLGDTWEALWSDVFDVYADQAFQYGNYDEDDVRREVDAVIDRAKALARSEGADDLSAPTASSSCL